MGLIKAANGCFHYVWNVDMFINVPENIIPILLLRPLFLLVFNKIFHLYFYSEL